MDIFTFLTKIRGMSFPFVQQHDAMDCGPSCLKMVAAYYGRDLSLSNLRETSFITREGVSFLGLSESAESAGFRTIGVRIPLDKLKSDTPLPWPEKQTFPKVSFERDQLVDMLLKMKAKPTSGI